MTLSSVSAEGCGVGVLGGGSLGGGQRRDAIDILREHCSLNVPNVTLKCVRFLFDTLKGRSVNWLRFAVPLSARVPECQKLKM